MAQARDIRSLSLEELAETERLEAELDAFVEKRAFAHETRSRIAKVEELSAAGYEPAVIASAAKLPQSLVEEMLRLASNKGGGGIT